MSDKILSAYRWIAFISLLTVFGLPLHAQSIDVGVVVTGQTVTAKAEVPGVIVEEYDTIVDGGGFDKWTHAGPGTWTTSISAAFSGTHTAYFKGKYYVPGPGPGPLDGFGRTQQMGARFRKCTLS